ncbi:hypothetical protein KY290_003505 [Solanum tuberosum]|uniref:Uncharacterized protein n=1 Tax=Solanum tuberosum TaxID=4113 RepID=A0ABQ7WT26_SOLTU|nr:hypothetical protein KY284_003637 [Solanum tuberosum]KAH0767615.1 hypothetical protein KY285_003486 [Solanum tuberosum]KAH0783907.1 hypothetical protein KY290_003505 [Solanum tuberosum]
MREIMNEAGELERIQVGRKLDKVEVANRRRNLIELGGGGRYIHVGEEEVERAVVQRGSRMEVNIVVQSNMMYQELLMSFRRGNFERSLNASLIVIFTKKEGTSSIGDYKPISLVGSIYKISKILDVALVDNEVVDSREKQGEPCVVCKLNFAELNEDLTVLVDFDLLKCTC